MDFLEPNWKDGTRTGPAVASGYRAAYSAQNNQMGRMFNGGINPGGFGSRNYLLTGNATDPEPIVYVAVVDSVGNWVYRLPADEAERIWPGIGRKRVAPTLQAAPSVRPAAVNPCTGGYCLVFTSNCQAANVTEAKAQGCGFNRNQGWCGNWFHRFEDTGQPLVPSSDCERDVRGGEPMPWCAEMVPTTGDASTPAGPPTSPPPCPSSDRPPLVPPASPPLSPPPPSTPPFPTPLQATGSTESPWPPPPPEPRLATSSPLQSEVPEILLRTNGDAATAAAATSQQLSTDGVLSQLLLHSTSSHQHALLLAAGSVLCCLCCLVRLCMRRWRRPRRYAPVHQSPPSELQLVAATRL